MDVAEELMEQLNCETVFTISAGGFKIPISEAVVVTWIIMAVLIVVSFILTRSLKINHISRRQAVAETIVTKLTGMVESMIGHEGRTYVPYLTTVLVYIGVADLVGLFGMKSPTKDLNVTIALAAMTIVLVEAVTIYKRGVGGWLKKFANPINILELVTRPLSLCMRLFGNVLGAFVIMELVKMVVPVILPAVLSCYFDIFDGLLQAYVFVFLSSMYLSEAIE